MIAGGYVCHRAELDRAHPALSLSRPHMTPLWELHVRGGRGGGREREVILGSGLAIQNTLVNHKQIFIT